MPVNPELQTILDGMNSGPPLDQVPVAILRQGGPPFPADPGAPMAKVLDLTVATPDGNIPVRIYRPRDMEPLPVLVYFHGGGWVLGSIDTHDSVARNLARSADCLVVSVGYRLAPEHRFPAAVDDCTAAVRWVHEQAQKIGADPARIALGGDSAGGNLATVVALRLRDEGGPAIAGQLLIYPVTQLRAPVRGSMSANAEGYFLRARDVAWFDDMYLGTSDAHAHPHASPLLAANLGGLAPALVITAEFDPLRDQGEDYAQRLQQAGVAVTLSRYDGAFHAFFGMPADISRRAVAEAGQWLRARFQEKNIGAAHVRGS
ncbi:MAG TPA: alpha/beta hydrolase [Steroidobacteraceae bacterium]|jgi:acetyl esterase